MTCRLHVIGDWGRRGLDHQRHVAVAMAERARTRPITAVVSTGDNFYEDGVASLADPHWDESFERVYDAPELQVPWIVALGNHDHRGRVASMLHRTALCDRWLMPERWYSGRLPVQADEDGPEIELIVLDTSVFLSRYRAGGAEEILGLRWSARAAEEQLAWLDERLAAPKPAWRVVVGHHPLWSGGSVHGPSEEMQNALGERLEGGGVDLYLAGHEHDLQHNEIGGVDHVVSGAAATVRATGRSWWTRFAAATPGFVEIDAEESELRATFVDGHGDVLHRFERSRAAERPLTFA